MCDRVGVLSRGRLVAEGPPAELRGDVDHVRIEVDDDERARAVISSTPGVSISTDGERVGDRGVLRIRLSAAVSPDAINAALVSAGVRVSALVPERDSLEDVFLTLVDER